MKVRLSEYESCVSSSDSQNEVSDQEGIKNEVFKAKKEKRQKKRRKSSDTPSKGALLKKANMTISPK